MVTTGWRSFTVRSIHSVYSKTVGSRYVSCKIRLKIFCSGIFCEERLLYRIYRSVPLHVVYFYIYVNLYLIATFNLFILYFFWMYRLLRQRLMERCLNRHPRYITMVLVCYISLVYFYRMLHNSNVLCVFMILLLLYLTITVFHPGKVAYVTHKCKV